ncbi:hypothetical protein B0T10DRAFT_199856 [Thelonectria olida]|uniref:RRM domain-containing protein n=1 Tax=Thelonectria olida TaxID=1576542 RepID=A0A9P8VV57_9HYPO|nr:hypothetical protein B0T10DRAFT_199856 [Thelonectria olida]
MKSKRAREATEPEVNHVDPVEVEAPSKKRKRTGDEDSADLNKAKKDKKEKKDKKDKKHKKESRKERKEKRKDLQDLPEQDDDEVDEKVTPATNGGVAEDSPMADAASQPAAAPADAAESEKSAKRDKKKEKKEKKEKKPKGKLQDTDAAANGDVENPASTGDKKKKKKDKKSSQDDSTTANTDADAATDGDANAEEADSAKKDRHIVFVGNLPFTATAATIEAHFSSLSPASVRCMSDPNSDKPCRGFAFVEFSKVWHMRTCLDKFHHSMFNDEVSPPRRINVELTAGGGGKTKKRKDKIIEKNRKLDENRTKRIDREKNAKEENKGNGNSATAQQQHMEDSIHPSRRARVPGEY